VLVGSLVATPTAGAAITASTITTPNDLSYFVYNHDTPNTFAISGTTTGGTTGDHVDISCYYGTSSRTVASNVAVSQNGSFSVPAADLRMANVYSPCRLRAVPAGTTPANLTPFAGPRVLVGYNSTSKVVGGPNDGTPYDFYMFAQQPAGGFDYDSLASCGVDDGYLSDSTLALTTVTFWCNAALFNQEASPGTRSELRIDGADAWPTWSARQINGNATGLPALTYTYQVNPHNGNLVIHDTEPLVKCTDKTYPPTSSTCPTFVTAGVTDHRTITQDHAGLVTWVTDVFTSTDGKKHLLDLLWANNQHFHYSNNGDSAQVAYKFPGQSSFSTHAVKDAVPLPKSAPAKIFVNVKGAADGDKATGQGAIVYDRPATQVAFVTVVSYDSQFTLHQTGTVPARGSTRFRFAYAQGYTAAGVAKLATTAAHAFTNCVVPKVKDKTLTAARRAITHSACAVGKIGRAFSSTVKKGHVVSQRPKAGKKLAYHARVSLVVSKGKK
jgi:hypothetical protein